MRRRCDARATSPTSETRDNREGRSLGRGWTRWRESSGDLSRRSEMRNASLRGRGSAMHYDEEEVLNNYILQHYGHLMTQLESRVIKAIRAEEKATNSQDERMRSLIRRRWGGLDDEQVVRALEAGAGSFSRGVRERLLREKGTEI